MLGMQVAHCRSHLRQNVGTVVATFARTWAYAWACPTFWRRWLPPREWSCLQWSGVDPNRHSSPL